MSLAAGVLLAACSSTPTPIVAGTPSPLATPAVLNATGTTTLSPQLLIGTNIAAVLTFPAIVPPPPSTPVQVRIIELNAPPNGVPVVDARHERSGMISAPRHRDGPGATLDQAVVYFEVTVNQNVTIGGYPGFALDYGGPGPLYAAFYDPSQPTPAWQLGIEGPLTPQGGFVQFPATSTPWSMTANVNYVFCIYQATGTFLRMNPASVAFTQPGQTAPITATGLPNVGVSATSQNTGVATVAPASMSTNGSGNASFIITAGPDAGATTVTFADSQGDTAVVPVTNTQTGGGLGIPGGPVITQYTTGIPTGAAPAGIASGFDGNIWFTEPGANEIGEIPLAGGPINQYTTGLSPSAGLGQLTLGDDGALWFTEDALGQLGSITTSGVISEYAGLTGSGLNGIASGPDHNLWFVMGDSVGTMGLAAPHTVSQYTLGAGSHQGEAIAAGPDGNLWFTDAAANAVGDVTTGGAITTYTTGITPSAGLTQIAAGSDGNLWFGENTAMNVARITPSGAVTEFSVSALGGAYAVAEGPDGNIWIGGANGLIGRMTPGGVLTVVNTGATGNITGITAGSDGNLYLTEPGSNAIGKVTL